MPFKINDNTDEQTCDFSKPGVQEGYDACARLAYNVLNEFILDHMSDSTIEKMWNDLKTELPDLPEHFVHEGDNEAVRKGAPRGVLLDYFTDQITVYPPTE